MMWVQKKDRKSSRKNYVIRMFSRSFKHSFYILWITISSCGQSITPLKDLLKNTNAHTNLTKYLNEKKWNNLFPHRYGMEKLDNPRIPFDFYSFKSFVVAARLFPAFLGEGGRELQKRELAAFLANIAQETSGGWKEAPDGYFRWGLHFLEENPEGQKNSYSDTTKKKYPPVNGKSYFGRGPKQFSWNYNYGQFSEAWYGNIDTLLQFPERLSSDPVLSYGSAIWFWMTSQKPKPSCHDIMLGKWIPTDDDILQNRMPGFGATVNVINGGVECGTGEVAERTLYRYQYYRYFCQYLGVEAGDNIDCDHQRPFGK